MSRQRYPIGIQTFSEIIEKGYTYVDKTGYIPELTRHGKYVFLSRPRQFGKSLLLSTLEAYFEGRRELFKGLALDSMDVDWTPSPVLHFNFTGEDYSKEDGLERIIDTFLTKYERIYGSEPRFVTPTQRFRHLIEAAYRQTGQQVVILVDEYDKPILAVEDNPKVFENNRALLSCFFANLKTMDAMIRYTFITGVARFILGDLNHLHDISFVDRFADICGLSEQELLVHFMPGIEALAQNRGESSDITLKELRDYYGGYLFTSEGSRLYTPYSVLCALKYQCIKSYWINAPVSLMKRIKALGIYPPKLNCIVCDRQRLRATGTYVRNPVPLIFQTGYLTIGSYERELGCYTLIFPNKQVEIGFYKDLLPEHSPNTDIEKKDEGDL